MEPGGISMVVEEDSESFSLFLLHQNIINCVDNITLKSDVYDKEKTIHGDKRVKNRH